MSSPQRIQIELQNEIQKRINHDSPTKYDIDFYLRKINRLEDDFQTVQEQLSRARVRLRRAEDYQIKYDLISKQNSDLKQQTQIQEREICQLKSQNEQLKNSLNEKSIKTDDYSQQRMILQQQIQKWRIKYEQIQEKKIADTFNQKQQSTTIILKQVQNIKKSYVDKQQNYQQQIRKLKKIVQEKKTVEGVVSNRVDKVRKDKDEEIGRLRQFIKNQKNSNNDAIHEKNQQIDRIKDKFEKMFNFELQGLKKNMQDQDQVFNIEVNGLREIISLKNDEIMKLLEEIKKNNEGYQKERQQMMQQIVNMREKIYSIERQHELQLFNTIERITKIHAQQIESLQKVHKSTIENLKNDCKKLAQQIKQRQRILQNEHNEVDRIRNDFYERIKQRDIKIDELKQNLKESGDMNEKQMNNLHQSFHKIQSQKQIITNQYQTNVNFLNQQLSKLTVSNDIKNEEIIYLQNQNIKIKKQNSIIIRDIQNKWRQDRKQKDNQKQKQRQLKQQLQQKIRQLERIAKIKQRQYQRQIQKYQRQKNKIQFLLQQSQKDIERLNLYIKNLDQNLKRQQKQNQLSTIDNGGIRRQLSAELDRQTIELETIKQLEIDQLRKKYEIKITKLTNQLQQIKTNLLTKNIAFQQLQIQFKKLQQMNKNIDKINKEKLLQYQKKMSTLNNQINLTQNLYKSFLQNKAKIDHKS